MDPITIVIVPGFIGGLLFALLLARLNRRSEQSDPFTAEWVQPRVSLHQLYSRPTQ